MVMVETRFGLAYAVYSALNVEMPVDKLWIGSNAMWIEDEEYCQNMEPFE